jgi:hypothetical protein
MIDTIIANNENNNDQEDEQSPSLEERSPQNFQLQTFVDRQRVDEPYVSTSDHIKHYIKEQCASLSFLYCLNTVLDKIPLIRCLKEYNIRKNLFGDIMAGITVAIMHIPQGK